MLSLNAIYSAVKCKIKLNSRSPGRNLNMETHKYEAGPLPAWQICRVMLLKVLLKHAFKSSHYEHHLLICSNQKQPVAESVRRPVPWDIHLLSCLVPLIRITVARRRALCCQWPCSIMQIKRREWNRAGWTPSMRQSSVNASDWDCVSQSAEQIFVAMWSYYKQNDIIE
jgi:hypothetical protein